MFVSVYKCMYLWLELRLIFTTGCFVISIQCPHNPRTKFHKNLNVYTQYSGNIVLVNPQPNSLQLYKDEIDSVQAESRERESALAATVRNSDLLARSHVRNCKSRSWHANHRHTNTHTRAYADRQRTKSPRAPGQNYLH